MAGCNHGCFTFCKTHWIDVPVEAFRENFSSSREARRDNRKSGDTFTELRVRGAPLAVLPARLLRVRRPAPHIPKSFPSPFLPPALCRYISLLPFGRPLLFSCFHLAP